MTKIAVSSVYAISDGTAVKIGKANDLPKRLKVFQTGNPRELILLAQLNCPSESIATAMESRLHRKFKESRLGGEWFDLGDYLIRAEFELLQREIDDAPDAPESSVEVYLRQWEQKHPSFRHPTIAYRLFYPLHTNTGERISDDALRRFKNKLKKERGVTIL